MSVCNPFSSSENLTTFCTQQCVSMCTNLVTVALQSFRIISRNSGNIQTQLIDVPSLRSVGLRYQYLLIYLAAAAIYFRLLFSRCNFLWRRFQVRPVREGLRKMNFSISTARCFPRDPMRKHGLCCRPVSICRSCIFFQTAEDIVELLTRPGSPIILVF